jgi:glycerol-3-phosphate dehydrogenase (NAD(P)+)
VKKVIDDARMKVTVLGAGYMGSAMAVVGRMRGHDVHLWGTWLDDAMVEPCLAGQPHPRLGLVLTEPDRGTITVHKSDALAKALDGASLVVHAISSDGAIPVMTRAAPYVPDVPVLSVTKGLLVSKRGTMDRIDVVVPETIGKPVRYVHAAGPAKAIEIARRVLTWMTFAGPDARACADAMGGEHLRVEVSDDIAGAELCSALKNAYATGLGLWDGHVGKDCHDARAACFTQAIVEMRAIALAGGGRAETVYGAPGVGDLHVTAAAGRNRAFGERVGRGRKAREVASEMAAEGQLTEGYAAIATAWRFARERGIERDLPLLGAIHAIVWDDADVGSTLRALRLSV